MVVAIAKCTTRYAPSVFAECIWERNYHDTEILFNVRVMKSGVAAGSTVVLKPGACCARIYHTLLIAAGWATMSTCTALASFY